jgi:phosphoserine phosphatase RsbU/P
MRPNRSPALNWLLVAYIVISLGYQIIASASLITGYFDLRHQIREPFETDFDTLKIKSVTPEANAAGVRIGDRLESLNGKPYAGRAQWQSIRWYSHPGDLIQVGVVHPEGSRAVIPVPTSGEPSAHALRNDIANRAPVGEASFILFLHVVLPLVCLFLGYWVALARPSDPNAWLILILLTYPEAFISVSTYNWWPGIWFYPRLGWHLALEALVPVALLFLGLLFPERSRVDLSLPWLKWVVLAIFAVGLAVGLAAQYTRWYTSPFEINLKALDAVNDKILNWLVALCLIFYWVLIFEKLRSASSPDNKRRLRVLWAGSLLGLGSMLIIWGALPALGILDPGNIQWLGYVSALLMLVFPLALAYVVIVQRAMDVRILLRMGTRYALARGSIMVVELAVAALIFFRFILPVLSDKQGGSFSAIVLAVAGGAVLIRLFVARRGLADRVREWVDRKFFREAYNAEVVLSDLADRVRTITEPSILLDTVTERISEVLHVPRIAVMLRSADRFQLQHSLGFSLNGAFELPGDSPAVLELSRTNSPAVYYGNGPTRLEPDHAARTAEFAQMEAEVLLPLPGRSHLMGIAALGSKMSEEPYTPSDLRLLQSIGVQTGLALEVSDLAQCLAEKVAERARIDREMEIAREVQQRLFPQCMPALPGLTLAGHCRPALGVGGDYYDVIDLQDGRLGLAIGDVSGKGISAALLMAGLRACLRTMLLATPMSLADLMTKMNQLVYESSAINRYATFFFAVYDSGTRRLQYVNAGHNAPILLGTRSHRDPVACERLETGGTVIGLLPTASYEEGAVLLAPGDLLIAYTDGISEAMTLDDQEWGEERMLQAAASVREEAADSVLWSVFQAADLFTEKAPQHDDMTLLVLKLSA